MATLANVSTTEQVFIKAHSLIAPIIAKDGLPLLSLDFKTLHGDTLSVLDSSFTKIHVNALHSLLQGFSLAAAVGVLAHEYGHLRYRRKLGHSCYDGNEPQMDEEKQCEEDAGRTLGALSLPTHDYKEFLRALEGRGFRKYDKYPSLFDAHEAIDRGASGNIATPSSGIP